MKCSRIFCMASYWPQLVFVKTVVASAIVIVFGIAQFGCSSKPVVPVPITDEHFRLSPDELNMQFPIVQELSPSGKAKEISLLHHFSEPIDSEVERRDSHSYLRQDLEEIWGKPDSVTKDWPAHFGRIGWNTSAGWIVARGSLLVTAGLVLPVILYQAVPLEQKTWQKGLYEVDAVVSSSQLIHNPEPVVYSWKWRKNEPGGESKLIFDAKPRNWFFRYYLGTGGDEIGYRRDNVRTERFGDSSELSFGYRWRHNVSTDVSFSLGYRFSGVFFPALSTTMTGVPVQGLIRKKVGKSNLHMGAGAGYMLQPKIWRYYDSGNSKQDLQFPDTPFAAGEIFLQGAYSNPIGFRYEYARFTSYSGLTLNGSTLSIFWEAGF